MPEAASEVLERLGSSSQVRSNLVEAEMKSHQQLAEVVRRHCIKAAEEAYEDAGVRGLCFEGRWECAIDAIRRLDLQAIVREREPEGGA